MGLFLLWPLRVNREEQGFSPLCPEQCLAHSQCSGDVMLHGPRDVTVIEHKSASGNYWVNCSLVLGIYPIAL